MSEQERFVYRGERARAISFPLGGIGTGSIGLSGSGRLVDWEIFNRPNKGSVNGYSHFAVKAMDGDRLVDARILNGPVLDRFAGDYLGSRNNTFGFGVRREALAGMPHFREADFEGTFPTAAIGFRDDRFPAAARLQAFNPFIPLNDRDSSMPAALFEIELANTAANALDFTVAAVLSNPLLAQNRTAVEDGRLLHLASDGTDPSGVGHGDLALATDAAETSFQRFWYRGEWFDQIEVYWKDFTGARRFADRAYPADRSGDRNHTVLAGHLRLEAGARGRVRFVIAWHFPNCENYWFRERAERACARAGRANAWRNWYASAWPDAPAVAREALARWDELAGETRRFRDALFGASLPPAVLDAVSANLSILKSPTVLRLEDGTFYGWEGSRIDEGACEGSCTHVWNYAQALPFLFPALERSMREADYAHNLRPDGGMPFRLQLPLGTGWSADRPCADGQLGGVMKVWRDWKLSGDLDWLRRLWPRVRASLEFAWSAENEDGWDPDRSGVLRGRQHHTLDMELFGPSSWLAGFYLGALMAGADMAEALGEPDRAAEYRAIFARGKAWVDRQLFNGDYYFHRLNVGDRSQLEAFAEASGSIIVPGTVMEMYWSEEHQEIKYQVGDGCLIDQVLAQWHADLYGLGQIFDRAQSARALDAVLRHNFLDPIGDAYNPCRVFALPDEAGTVVCTWPVGARKPAIPVVYSQETFHGCEYAFAAQLIQHGRVEDGVRVAAAVRERYDGARRNPWNEMECGSNYARSMASFSLLLALAGFAFDAGRGMLGFAPRRIGAAPVVLPWFGGTAWGLYRETGSGAELRLLGGGLMLAELRLPFAAARALVGDEPVAAAPFDGGLRFEPPLRLDRDQLVRVEASR